MMTSDLFSTTGYILWHMDITKSQQNKLQNENILYKNGNRCSKYCPSNFRGVFLRNTLPKRPKKNECGILNLDDTSGNGTHWVAWYKNGKNKYYFDSFGVQPPTELITYLSSPIHYNTEEIQPRDQVFCGHLCLYVLKHLSDGEKFQDVINTLY